MNKGLIINEDVWGMIDELEPDEKAELLTVLSAYYQGEEIPETGRIVRMVFKRVAADNVRFDPDHRKEVSETRAAAGQKGAQARWQNMANDGKNGKMPQDKIREDKNRQEEIRERRFTPPTPEEVMEYALDNGIKIDAQRFVDFYSSKGWMVGKTKMKDWKAAVRNWAARDRKETTKEAPKTDYRSQLLKVDYGELLRRQG